MDAQQIIIDALKNAWSKRKEKDEKTAYDMAENLVNFLDHENTSTASDIRNLLDKLIESENSVNWMVVNYLDYFAKDIGDDRLLLWSEQYFLNRMYAVGDRLTHENQNYVVKIVDKITDNIYHVYLADNGYSEIFEDE